MKMSEISISSPTNKAKTTAKVKEARKELEKLKSEIQLLINTNLKPPSISPNLILKTSENVIMEPPAAPAEEPVVSEVPDIPVCQRKTIHLEATKNNVNIATKPLKRPIRSNVESSLEKKQIKTKHYDPEKTREFMKKQKLLRLQKEQEERFKKREQEELKKQKLLELRQRTLKLVKENLQKSVHCEKKISASVGSIPQLSQRQSRPGSSDRNALTSRRNPQVTSRTSDQQRRSRSLSRDYSHEVKTKTSNSTTSVIVEKEDIIPDEKELSTVDLKELSTVDEIPTITETISTSLSEPSKEELSQEQPSVEQPSQEQQSEEQSSQEQPSQEQPSLIIDDESPSTEFVHDIFNKLRRNDHVPQPKKCRFFNYTTYPDDLVNLRQPDPFNFISTVRRKLELSRHSIQIREPKIQIQDISIQCPSLRSKINVSIQCQIPSPSPEIREEIPSKSKRKSCNNDTSSLKDVILVNNDSSKKTADEISDADTAKNIPDISDEESPIVPDFNSTHFRNVNFSRREFNLNKPAATLINNKSIEMELKAPNVHISNKRIQPQLIPSPIEEKTNQSNSDQSIKSKKTSSMSKTEFSIITELNLKSKSSQRPESESSIHTELVPKSEIQQSKKEQTSLKYPSDMDSIIEHYSSINLSNSDDVISSIHSKKSSSIPEDIIELKSETTAMNIVNDRKAEVHLLNSFNSSLEQVIAIDKSLNELQDKENSFSNTTFDKSIDSSYLSNINTKRGSEVPSSSKDIMYDQLIKDQDSRLEHFKAIMKLRDKALFDRIKGELTWLEIQKKELRDTGQLNHVTMIKKKQRGLLIKLEQERHEMQRLKQAHKQAAKERKNVLRQQKNLIKSQLSSNEQIPRKIRRLSRSESRQSGPLKVLRNPDQLSDSTMSIVSSQDGEKSIQSARTTESEKNANFKKTLLMKEESLEKRRKNVEELLEWNNRLKVEEARIAELELKAKEIQNETKRFSGAQLNQIWFSLTGSTHKRFDDTKSYQMSKRSLANAIKVFKNIEEQSKRLDDKEATVFTDRKTRISGLDDEKSTSILSQEETNRSIQVASISSSNFAAKYKSDLDIIEKQIEQFESQSSIHTVEDTNSTLKSIHSEIASRICSQNEEQQSVAYSDDFISEKGTPNTSPKTEEISSKVERQTPHVTLSEDETKSSSIIEEVSEIETQKSNTNISASEDEIHSELINVDFSTKSSLLNENKSHKSTPINSELEIQTQNSTNNSKSATKTSLDEDLSHKSTSINSIVEVKTQNSTNTSKSSLKTDLDEDKSHKSTSIKSSVEIQTQNSTNSSKSAPKTNLDDDGTHKSTSMHSLVEEQIQNSTDNSKSVPKTYLDEDKSHKSTSISSSVEIQTQNSTNNSKSAPKTKLDEGASRRSTSINSLVEEQIQNSSNNSKSAPKTQLDDETRKSTSISSLVEIKTQNSTNNSKSINSSIEEQIQNSNSNSKSSPKTQLDDETRKSTSIRSLVEEQTQNPTNNSKSISSLVEEQTQNSTNNSKSAPKIHLDEDESHKSSSINSLIEEQIQNSSNNSKSAPKTHLDEDETRKSTSISSLVEIQTQNSTNNSKSAPKTHLDEDETRKSTSIHSLVEEQTQNSSINSKSAPKTHLDEDKSHKSSSVNSLIEEQIQNSTSNSKSSPKTQLDDETRKSTSIRSLVDEQTQNSTNNSKSAPKTNLDKDETCKSTSINSLLEEQTQNSTNKSESAPKTHLDEDESYKSSFINSLVDEQIQNSTSNAKSDPKTQLDDETRKSASISSLVEIQTQNSTNNSKSVPKTNLDDDETHKSTSINSLIEVETQNSTNNSKSAPKTHLDEEETRKSASISSLVEIQTQNSTNNSKSAPKTHLDEDETRKSASISSLVEIQTQNSINNSKSAPKTHLDEDETRKSASISSLAEEQIQNSSNNSKSAPKTHLDEDDTRKSTSISSSLEEQTQSSTNNCRSPPITYIAEYFNRKSIPNIEQEMITENDNSSRSTESESFEKASETTKSSPKLISEINNSTSQQYVESFENEIPDSEHKSSATSSNEIHTVEEINTESNKSGSSNNNIILKSIKNEDNNLKIDLEKIVNAEQKEFKEIIPDSARTLDDIQEIPLDPIQSPPANETQRLPPIDEESTVNTSLVTERYSDDQFEATPDDERGPKPIKQSELLDMQQRCDVSAILLENTECVILNSERIPSSNEDTAMIEECIDSPNTKSQQLEVPEQNDELLDERKREFKKIIAAIKHELLIKMPPSLRNSEVDEQISSGSKINRIGVPVNNNNDIVNKIRVNKGTFVSEAEELRRKQLEIEQEIKKLERQTQSIPYCFVREIPNKPPPPYKPPEFSKKATVIKSLVPLQEQEISRYIDRSVDILFPATQIDCPNLDEYQLSTNTVNAQKFIFDLCKEILQTEIVKPKLNSGFLNVLKASKTFTDQMVRDLFSQKVLQCLNLRPVNRVDSVIARWSRKKRDHVDNILVTESHLEEAQWIHYDRDEQRVKENMTKQIMQELLLEAYYDFMEILNK